jgi:hypothetical protein
MKMARLEMIFHRYIKLPEGSRGYFIVLPLPWPHLKLEQAPCFIAQDLEIEDLEALRFSEMGVPLNHPFY